MINQNNNGVSLKIATAHLGLAEVREEEVLYFSAGLPPFHDLHSYVLLGKEEEEPFLWLQSVEVRSLALVVAPYQALMAQPAPALAPVLRVELGLLGEEQPEAYVIISLGVTPEETTMNLLAPVYVCRRTGRAEQVILQGELGLTRVPLPQNLEAA